MDFPQIQLGNFILTEPTTAISDVAITFLCIWIFNKLNKYKSESRSIRPWQFFFLLMGISTFFGAVVHGLRYYQNEDSRTITWIIMNVISGTAVYLGQTATLRSHFTQSKYKTLLYSIATIQLVSYYIILVVFKNYNVVKLNVALGMLPIMFLNLFYYSKDQPGTGWIASGIAVSILSAVVHGLKISFGEWFNYNDISHIILMITFSMMWYGVAVASSTSTSSV